MSKRISFFHFFIIFIFFFGYIIFQLSDSTKHSKNRNFYQSAAFECDSKINQSFLQQQEYKSGLKESNYKPSHSWHHCVSNVPEKNTASHIQSCQFHHICFHKSVKKFQYYQAPVEQAGGFFFKKTDHSQETIIQEKILTDLPLVGLSGRIEDRSRNFNLELLPNSASPVQEAVTWIEGHTIFAQLHAAGNAGHLILENAMPILNLIELFGENRSKTRLIFRDSCENIFDEFTMGDGGYENCVKFFNTYLSPITGMKPVDWVEYLEIVETPYICFDRLTVGMSALGLHQNNGQARGTLYRNFREVIRQSLGLQPNINCNQFDIVFHQKIGRRNILNTDEITSFLSTNISSYKGFPVNIQLINLDLISNADTLIQKIMDIDVLISSGGSALFHSILMHDGAVVIGAPLWDRNVLLDFEFNILQHIPYVHFQMHPASRNDINYAKNGINLDRDKTVAELKEALYFSYNYKKKFYCLSM